MTNSEIATKNPELHVSEGTAFSGGREYPALKGEYSFRGCTFAITFNIVEGRGLSAIFLESFDTGKECSTLVAESLLAQYGQSVANVDGTLSITMSWTTDTTAVEYSTDTPDTLQRNNRFPHVEVRFFERRQLGGPAQTAADPIGLGLDKLHLGMSMADARAAYPALSGDPQMGLLTGAYELDRCAFALALEFGNDSLAQVELDTATDVESCKTAVMGRIMAQYGPSQKGCPIWSGAVYMKVVGPLEIYITDNQPLTADEYVKQPRCPKLGFAPMGTAGVSDGRQRHLGVIFQAAGSGITIFQ